MRELVTSFANACLAKALYAGQSVAKALGAPPSVVTPKSPPGPGPEADAPPTLAGRLYKGTKQTITKFGDPAAVAYIAGEEYISKGVDFFSNLFAPPKHYKSYWSSLPKQVGTQLGLAAGVLSQRRRLYALEANNARYIFVLVRNNPEKLGIPETGEFDLAHFLEKAYSMGDFENIWTVEGLGHVYSQRTWVLKWNVSEDARDILVSGQASCLTDKSLTMMHAGLGLCLAESLIKQLTPDSDTKTVERVLKTFIRLCNNNSRPGYAGCALESLGLVTRCFNYPMVNLVQQTLADVDPVAWEFFWRGAGRALYFAPAHLLQPVYSPWIAAEQEAPNEFAFKSLKAGLTWAINVVNMRTPQIFESLIKTRGAEEERDGAVRHGVAASTTMAIDITPNHPVVKAYLDYQPESSDPRVRDLWNKLVHEPAYKAVTRYQPILKKHKMLDQVFRFQDLDALVNRLESAESTQNIKQATNPGN